MKAECDYCGEDIKDNDLEIQPSTGAKYHKDCLVLFYREAVACK